MAWLGSFLLGRPNFESSFTINPSAMKIKETQLAARNRVLNGGLKKWVFRTTFPTIQINSNYFQLADRNIFASLLTVTDTFLSFQTRNGDWQQQLEINYPTGVPTTLPIQVNSATKLSAAIVAAGGSSIITINGVWQAITVSGGVAVGSGTNFYTGGSYSDATYTINLGTPLVMQSACYVSYSYTGWLVDLQEIGYNIEGGWLDKFNYDYSLTGV